MTGTATHRFSGPYGSCDPLPGGLPSFDKTSAEGQLRWVVRKFPGFHLLKTRSIHHVHQAEERRAPPVGIVVSVLFARVKFHDHLVPGIAVPQSSPVRAVIIADGGFLSSPDWAAVNIIADAAGIINHLRQERAGFPGRAPAVEGGSGGRPGNCRRQ